MSYNINQTHFPSIQIYLNSKYADAYGNIPSQRSWCYFNFKEPIVKLPEAYNFLIRLNRIELPCSMYAVNNSNNTATFTVEYISVPDASPSFLNIPITLPNGNYSALDFVSIFNTLYNNVTNPVVLSAAYNAQNNTFSFIATLVNGSSLVSLSVSSAPTTIFGLSGSTITSNTVLINAQALQYISVSSDVGVDLAGTRAVFVKCLSIHTPGFDSRSKYSGTNLARIPISQEPFGIVFWDNRTGFKSMCSLKNVSSLEIQITDEDGNLVDFNSIDWTMTLQLDIINGSPTDFTPNVPFIK